MSGLTSFTSQFENSDNVFLKLPHIFKPLQVVNAVVLAICIGSTAGSENGVLWFIIISAILISTAATVIFAMGLQDSIMESISNGQLTWNMVELIYSFVLAILGIISVWMSFALANKHLGGTSAGYIAAGLFSIIHVGLYGVPCFMLYDSIQANSRANREAEITVHPAHPFREAPYQDL